MDAMHSVGGIESRKIKVGKRCLILRPLHPTDIRRVQEFFYSHEPETIRMRYGHTLGRRSPEAAYELVNVDQKNDFALGIFQRHEETSFIHAMGGYYLDPGKSSAEVAFVVGEKLRREGLATLLLRDLAEIARRYEVKQFWAQVHRTNHAMLGLFAKFDPKQEAIPGEDSVTVTMEVDSIR